MQPSSKLRQRIRELCRRKGGDAIPVENSVNVGLPDLLLLYQGTQIWVELKCGNDRLSRPQAARCCQLKAWVLYYKRNTYTLAKVKTKGGFMNTFVETVYNSESLDETLDFLFSGVNHDKIYQGVDDPGAGASSESGDVSID